MSDDYYLQRGKERMDQIHAERAAAVAELQSAKARYDDDSAALAIQQIADLDAAAENLNALCNRYVASQYPPAPPQQSPEEKAAKPLSHMNYGDVYEMVKNSKYGVDDDAFRRGIDYVRANPSVRR
jgi:hypothetical protein